MMPDFVTGFLHAAWVTFEAMAPYLALGLVFAGILHVFFTKRFVARHLGSNSPMVVVKAAALGVPLPLCSCGVIPTALSLRKSRASEGAVMSFLISTPQTGVDSIVATWGMMGPVFAIFRPIAAFVMGVAGGFAVRFRHPDSVASTAAEGPEECVVCNATSAHTHTWTEKGVAMWRYAFGTFLDDISVQLLIGVLVAAAIAFLVPDGALVKLVSNDFVGMLLMVVIGIPMYVCATASIPIAVALMLKGLSPGAAFVFLCVGPATNAATLLLVSRAMGRRFALFYVGTMIVGGLLAGIGLNTFFDATGLEPVFGPHAGHVHEESGAWWLDVVVYAFLVVLVASLARVLAPRWYSRIVHVFSRPKPIVGSDGAAGVTFSVEGMTCSHCASHVREALEGVQGVREVDVDLAGHRVRVRGTAGEEALREAVRVAGYKPF